MREGKGHLKLYVNTYKNAGGHERNSVRLLRDTASL